LAAGASHPQELPKDLLLPNPIIGNLQTPTSLAAGASHPQELPKDLLLPDPIIGGLQKPTSLAAGASHPQKLSEVLLLPDPVIGGKPPIITKSELEKYFYPLFCRGWDIRYLSENDFAISPVRNILFLTIEFTLNCHLSYLAQVPRASAISFLGTQIPLQWDKVW
jgi:hypothetical protein